MIFWYANSIFFLSKCQLESLPGQLLQSPMPNCQSWSILGTHLLSNYLGTAYSPMLTNAESPVLPYGHLFPGMLTGLPQASLVEFSRIPYCTVLQNMASCGIWLLSPYLHLSKSNLHNSFNIQYYLIVPSSLFFTYIFFRSSKWP